MSTVKNGIKSGLKTIKFDLSKLPEAEIIGLELINVLSDSKGLIGEMCNHLLKAGGKRVRPLLVLYSGLLFSDMSPELLRVATAAELIHMASLVHDDIIDNSSLRRGKPSTNKVWGNHLAVLCGDYLFAKAFEILSDDRLLRSMNYMVNAIHNMCHSEIKQAYSRFKTDISIEEYYELISGKTAVFLECCCKSGALIGGANELQSKIIAEYGLNLGLAFQIIDDILDFCGDVKIMGKPRGEDLRQGNITLPLILLFKNKKYEHLYKKIFKELINQESPSELTIENLALILKESGVINEGYRIASSHIDKAKQSLRLLLSSRHMELLLELADMLQARIN